LDAARKSELIAWPVGAPEGPWNGLPTRFQGDLLHGLIVDACNNRVLADILRKLRQRTHMFNLNNLLERFIPGTAEHLTIIGALERGDADAAQRAMTAHLENVKRSILNRIGGT